MALADYFERSALAASQVLEGFDPGLFKQKLETTSVGIAFGPEATHDGEGAHVLDLVVRLMARLYPSLDITCQGPGDTQVARISRLARSINPAIGITHNGRADAGVVIGTGNPKFETAIFAGADGWDAYVSATEAQPLGSTNNPLGSGVAACIAAANIFRRVFTPDWETEIDSHITLSTYSMNLDSTSPSISNFDWQLPDEGVLAGVGAIGMAAVWALARAPISGTIHLVDPEEVELSNLQRYVLVNRSEVGRPKVRIASRLLRGPLNGRPHQVDWREFVTRHGYRWSWVLTALDSAQARREVQSSLPQWVANAWTQPGDLGVSVHPTFGGLGACLGCLYLPEGKAANEDELIAVSLGIPGRVAEVRTLLHLGTPVPNALLMEIADALRLKRDDLDEFQDRPIRDLYVRGICGGALLPLGRAGTPSPAVHVPLPHQSALAGILLAAKLCRMAAGGKTSVTSIARIDVLRKVPLILEQAALRRGDGRCLCDDADFTEAYTAKYSTQSFPARAKRAHTVS